jgi:hypothetical protein
MEKTKSSAAQKMPKRHRTETAPVVSSGQERKGAKVMIKAAAIPSNIRRIKIRLRSGLLCRRLYFNNVWAAFCGLFLIISLFSLLQFFQVSL